MATKTCSGTIVALGQCEYDMHGTRYAYIEIERRDGRVLRANNVLVLNNVGSLMCAGVSGTFFFDSAVLKVGVIRQLFGIRRADGRWAYDAMQVRLLAAVCNIVQGALLSFVIVGMPFVLLGMLQLVFCVVMAQRRRALFFGRQARSGVARPHDAVVRI